MELTHQQIISAATGIVRAEKTDKGIELHRFTRSQEEYWYKPHPYFCKEEFFNGYFGRGSRTSAGITLDFYTDATEIIIRIAENEQPNQAELQIFDLYVNDKFNHSYSAKENIVYQSKKGKKRYTLYFPYYNFPIISGISLREATIFQPVGTGVDVLCLGDSITHGGNSVHPSKTWVTVMARKLGVRVINQGNSGFIHDKNVIEKVGDPKIVVTAYGVNDYGRKSAEQMENETGAYIEKLKNTYPNAKIAAILPLWTSWNDNPGNWYDDKRAILRKIYEEHNVYVIDGFKMIPHNTKYLADGLLHPNDEGFVYYGNRVAKELKKFL